MDYPVGKRDKTVVGFSSSMLFFSHTGITLGAALLLARLTRQYSGQNKPVSNGNYRPEYASIEKDPQKTAQPSIKSSLIHHVDLRLLLIGSMLPDIIDKPLGHLFFGETISNGRIFSHTGLFLIISTLLGLLLYYRFKRIGMLVLTFGVAMHLVLDQMWQDYHTLLWPMFGLTFQKNDITDWIPGMWHALLSNPWTYIPEIIGTLIIILFACSLIRKNQLFSFFKTGKMVIK